MAGEAASKQTAARASIIFMAAVFANQRHLRTDWQRSATLAAACSRLLARICWLVR